MYKNSLQHKKYHMASNLTINLEDLLRQCNGGEKEEPPNE